MTPAVTERFGWDFGVFNASDANIGFLDHLGKAYPDRWVSILAGSAVPGGVDR